MNKLESSTRKCETCYLLLKPITLFSQLNESYRVVTRRRPYWYTEKNTTFVILVANMFLGVAIAGVNKTNADPMTVLVQFPVNT